jgi:glucose uptake protein GlcU
MSLLYGALPGALSGALVGSYHYKVTLAFNKSRWPGVALSEPWGMGHGLVLGALIGTVVFALARRRWPRLPAPVIAILSAGCVAVVGIIFSSGQAD